jgi:rhomboid protease GluP
MQDDSRSVSATIALRQAPFWTPSILLVVLAAAGAPLGFVLGRMNTGIRPSQQELLLLVAFMLVAVSVVAILRWRTRPRSAPAIVLERDRLRLPVTSHSSRTRDVAYEDVLSVDVFGEGRRARVLVNTRGKLYVYPRASFDRADPVAPLRTGIRVALAAQGAGTLIDAMDQRESLGKQAWLMKPWMTIALLALIGIVFLVELLLGALDGTFALVKYGANAPALVWDGQWFRLFSANFLHLNALHVWMNAVALVSLGLLLEKLTGRWRFICIYLLSALGGALVSALLAQAAFSVGASTAIYGLLGSLAVLNWKYRVQLPSGFRQTPAWWIFIVTLNVVLAALLPAIDIGAHAGGALAGAATTLALYRGVEVIRVERRPGRALGAVVSVVIAVFGVALVATALHLRTGNAEQDSLTVARDFVNSTATKPAALNSFAWDVYLDEQASEAELELALQAVRMAIARQDDAEFFDSEAALLFRTGQDEEALRSELRALALQDKDFFWWQLTRYLAYRVDEHGPLLPVTVTEPPQLFIVQAGRSAEIELRGTHGCAAGCTIYALVKQGPSVVGVLQLLVGTEARPALRLKAEQVAGAQALPRHASLELALLDAGTCGACTARDIRGRYVALDEQLH